jgi:hypothetical protein
LLKNGAKIRLKKNCIRNGDLAAFHFQRKPILVAKKIESILQQSNWAKNLGSILPVPVLKMFYCLPLFPLTALMLAL